MIFCDLTHAYTATGGGIRTYIDAKREYILRHTPHEHLLIVPGECDDIEAGVRWTTHRIKAPLIPGAAPYRFFTRPSRIVAALERHRPDVVELNSLYSEPWAAFRYRRTHPHIQVSGYFFTDVPEAYVGAPVRDKFGPRFARPMKRMAEKYVGRVFRRCDLACAPSPEQAVRLHEMGVNPSHVVMPGVDLDLFDPSLRDARLRSELQSDEGGLLLLYVGRLDAEKHVRTLVEATKLVNRQRPATLLIAGNGPMRKSLEGMEQQGVPVRVLGFVSDRTELARIMASSDVYVTAGPHETFAFSVVEAQASGLPVVGVAAGALVERVDDRLGRLGPVDDAPTMAANILEAADRKHEMGKAARTHVERNLSWRATFDRLFALYDEALADSADAVTEPAGV
ncbi:MAG: glycosyltransferase [Bacteroidota bacterium]